MSPDWRLLAVVEEGLVPGVGEPLPQASIRDLFTEERTHQLPPCVWPKGFSTDGSMLVVDGPSMREAFTQCSQDHAPAEIDHRSRVIDVSTGEVVLDLGNRGLMGSKAVFNPSGVFDADRYLAVNVGLEVVEIHDVMTGELVASIDVEGDVPLTLSFDPTGQYLAIGGQNSHAWVVDVEALVGGSSVEEATVMYQQVGSGLVAFVALGPDGLLATSASDPNVRLWDIHSGELVQELAKTPDGPRPVSFSPEGDLLYVDGDMEQGHVVRRLHLDANRLIELAESRVTRSLTEEECERYVPDSNQVPCP